MSGIDRREKRNLLEEIDSFCCFGGFCVSESVLPAAERTVTGIVFEKALVFLNQFRIIVYVKERNFLHRKGECDEHSAEYQYL